MGREIIGDYSRHPDAYYKSPWTPLRLGEGLYAMAAMGAGVEAAEGRHRGRLWVDSGRSIAVPRMAGFGASFPFGLAPPEVR